MGLLMIMSVNSWYSIQCSLFVMSFMFGSFAVGGSVNCMGFGMGLDYISYVLIWLSIWIMSLVVSSSQKVYDSMGFNKVFLVINMLLLISLTLSFACLDYILFYLCFESTLIPTMILILGWGYQPERLQAGVYMLFYTLFGSLPLLISFLSIYSMSGTSVYGLCGSNLVDSSVYCLWYLCSVVAFVVKLPAYIVHLWLPKAHVEAPVAGSMILAGVLLKLGGYGLVRVSSMFVSQAMKFGWVWMSLGLVGGSWVSILCMRESDVKSLIAYSSVAHMGLVLCGLMVLSYWGLCGSLALMVGHGLCSSGLFSLANMSYERLGTRSFFVSKGLMNLMPSLALWWFLLSVGNIAAPPTLSLVGEIGLIVSIVSWCPASAVFVGVLSFFSCAYTLYLYSSAQHGKYFSSLFSCCSGKVREYLVLVMHWLPLNILVLKCGILIC
uniref:NADH dehydrogenase subunit 4 n=1 Tax=Periclimenes brevicarpalis TaxID=390963 RepID=UPI001FA71D25|nr:NADH dehydrogenase subunit 4 [Periclimenes brevicarpalis]UMY76335.1 NADH dehydrogenase subunit 4 [Periclimenes brevicarpalis]